MSPEELQARAARAYRAYFADSPSGEIALWSNLVDDEKRPWLAAVHAAVSYRPPSERGKSTQFANASLKIAQIHALAGELLEDMTP